VTALDGIGETVKSAEVSGTTTSSNKKIKVSWDRVSGAQTYNVYRSTTSGTYTTPSLLRSAAIATDPLSYTDDGTVSLTTGAPPVASTVDAVAMQVPIEMFNFNFADYEIANNKFYLPHSTFTSGLFYKAALETQFDAEAISLTVLEQESGGTALVPETGLTYVPRIHNWSAYKLPPAHDYQEHACACG
jgi:hypothetical protein